MSQMYQKAPVDNHVVVINSDDSDIIRLQKYNTLARGYSNVDSVKKYAKLELDLAREMGEIRYKAMALSYLSKASFNSNDYPNACQYAFRAVVNADTIGDKPIAAQNYFSLARSYARMRNFVKANEYYSVAVEMFKELNDSANLCQVYLSMGTTNRYYGSLDVAEQYIQEALCIDNASDNVSGLADDYYQMGVVAQKRFEEAKNEEVAIKMLRKSKGLLNKAKVLAHGGGNMLALLHCDSQLAELLLLERSRVKEMSEDRSSQILDSCKFYLDEAFGVLDFLGVKYERADVNMIWASYLIASKMYVEAESFLDSVMCIYKKDESVYRRAFYPTYNRYMELYKAKDDKSKALMYAEKAHEEYSRVVNLDYAVSSAQFMAKAEADKMRRERVIMGVEDERVYENQSRVRGMLAMSSVIALVITIVLTFLSIRFGMKSHRANQKLDEKNAELEERQLALQQKNNDLENQKDLIESQKSELERQHRQIVKTNEGLIESLNYASLIQKAVMPNALTMNTIFGDHLIIYKPLNIVSGDFYWANQSDECKVLVVGDCTGHGVPGAFLSMLGMSILSNLTATHEDVKEVSAAKMLDDMRDEFERAMRQNSGMGESQGDGIDVSLVVIERKTMIMHYAGAFRPIVVIHDGVAQKLSPDRMPIGKHYRAAKNFTEHTMQLAKGDVIYMFTDGITDQFGLCGNEEKKYTIKRLISLLLRIYKLPFSMQRVKYELDQDDWRASAYATADEKCEQTDDALLVGVRV